MAKFFGFCGYICFKKQSSFLVGNSRPIPLSNVNSLLLEKLVLRNGAAHVAGTMSL